MSDRIFGLVVILVALAFIASATQIQTSFMQDPLGSKTFPVLVGGVAVLCGGVMLFRPDAEPAWPALRVLASLGLSLLVLVLFALALRPLGFLLPTALAAGLLSYQIRPRRRFAVLTGIGLSLGLFLLFRYALGLGLQPFPRSWM